MSSKSAYQGEETRSEQQPKRLQKQKEVERHRLEAALEDGLEETFPASRGSGDRTAPSGNAGT
jgi:hypothetical protein